LKRIVSIIVLLILFYNVCGFILIHPVLSDFYKHRGIEKTKEHSKRELTELLIFSKDDLKDGKIKIEWIHSREFRYNGNMYDIFEKEEDENYYYYYCINDTKEKGLEDRFKKKVEENSANSKQTNYEPSTLKILFSELLKKEFDQSQKENGIIFNNCITKDYPTSYSEVPTPPPQKS
jgi:hypothetical protein